MAQESPSDRFIIDHSNATINDLKHTITQAEGLAEAIELKEQEQLRLKVNHNKIYGLHLSRTIQRETVYVSSYASARDRKKLIDSFLRVGQADRDNNLRNIISSRMVSGNRQAAWQYQCHPMLLALIEISKIKPDKFIGAMKGHIGRFRTYPNESDFSDNHRRNFSKILFPLSYEAKGGAIVIGTIQVSNEVQITFRNNAEGQAATICLGGQVLPETVSDGLIGQNFSSLFDNLELNEVLANETIEKITRQQNATIISCQRRPYVPMAIGGDIVDQECDRIIRQLYQWAEADPFPCDN